MRRTTILNRMTSRTTSRKLIAVLGVLLAGLSMQVGARAADRFDSACPKPAWPKEAANKTGTVTLALLIATDSKVKQAVVTKSSGHAELDEAARSGMAKCLFAPKVVDGKPVEAWVGMQYVWAQE